MALRAKRCLLEGLVQWITCSQEACNCKGKYALFELWRPVCLG